MKADITRQSFDPLKHFSRVLMQQGRVQLDSDWNDQAAIVLHMIRRLAADVFPFGGGSGFGITALSTAPPVVDDFAIGAGSYYAGGILCEIESTPVPVVKWDGPSSQIVVPIWTVDGVPYRSGQYVQLIDGAAQNPQLPITAKIADAAYATLTLKLDADIRALKDFMTVSVRRLLTYRTQPTLSDGPGLPKDVPQQVYLDVWECAVTSAEDDSIREVALNGPDTGARTKVMWQVGTTPLAPAVFDATGTTAAADAGVVCITPQALANALRPGPNALLRARTEPAQISPDPCTISPESAYRGPENQLYRVEIHTPSSGDPTKPPTFKWSRENGCVVFPVVKVAVGSGTTTVTLASLGRDERFGLAEGDYVEFQDDRSLIANVPGTLLQIESVDRTSFVVTLTGAPAAPVAVDPALHPLLRRWDHKTGDRAQGGLTIRADGAAEIPANEWLNLEDGVQVQFADVPNVAYRAADYWLIPARVATGDVIWPTESGTDAQGNAVVNPVPRPPDGVTHHYVPLAAIKGGTAAPVVKFCSQLAPQRTLFLRTFAETMRMQ